MLSLRLFLACFAVISSSAFATPFLHIVEGELVGIQNIEVDNTSYNIRFQTGSCIELFDNCTKSVFGSLDGEIVGSNHSGVIDEVNNAMLQLKNALDAIVNSNEYQNFDWSKVQIVTPFRARGDVFVTPSMDTYKSLSFFIGHFSHGDGSVANDHVRKYAIWDVPEPSNLVLLSIALGSLLLTRRKSIR